MKALLHLMLALTFLSVFFSFLSLCILHNVYVDYYQAARTVVWWLFSFVFTGDPWRLAAFHAFMSSTLECVRSNGKICVDLFIKAHLGTLKVEKSNSRNVLRCCSEWMWLPEGNIGPLHRPVFTEAEFWLAMPSLHDMMLKNG